MDDDSSKHNKYLYGKKLFQKKNWNICRIKIIKSLVISIPSLSEKKLKNIKDMFTHYVNEISFIPLKLP